MSMSVDILLEEAAHLARATVAQTYLVRQEAQLIEAALYARRPAGEFDDQDDPHVHHVRPGQCCPQIINNVIPFEQSKRNCKCR